MELQAQLQKLSERVATLKDQIKTEEATKTAFVLPFINLLGYDIFNPTEVVPEFIADLGIKKGEKVDYAIFQEGNPILIIECKHWNCPLDVHNSQLFRYFHVTKTRFALLTNGIEYRFYTDLEHPNKMDEKPFLEFDITQLKDSTMSEIAKFHKSNFNIEKILSTASSLKYIKEIKKLIISELQEPSYDFTRYFASQVYSGRFTEKVMLEFKDLVKKSFTQLVSERVSDRLTSALNSETDKTAKVVDQADAAPEIPLNEVVNPNIKTSEEELEGFQIVRAIARRKIPVVRIHHRDTQSYFGILLDDNNRKPIVRLHLNGGKKYISLFSKDKLEIKEPLNVLEDIYNYEQQILDILDHYENG
ncbi:MAG: type I restriction enzyme HsdR N-terminal domain-containing protein [Bacteroidetes bacterium]|nr:type I restriction enzyme HsdR N-terminal domain-containing protein [Bacteroidota bacterium]